MKRDTFLLTGVKSTRARKIEDIEKKFYYLMTIMEYLYTNYNKWSKTTTWKNWPVINLDKFEEWRIDNEYGVLVQHKILRHIKWKIWYQEIIFDWYILSSIIDIYKK